MSSGSARWVRTPHAHRDKPASDKRGSRRKQRRWRLMSPSRSSSSINEHHAAPHSSKPIRRDGQRWLSSAMFVCRASPYGCRSRKVLPTSWLRVGGTKAHFPRKNVIHACSADSRWPRGLDRRHHQRRNKRHHAPGKRVLGLPRRRPTSLNSRPMAGGRAGRPRSSPRRLRARAIGRRTPQLFEDPHNCEVVWRGRRHPSRTPRTYPTAAIHFSPMRAAGRRAAFSLIRVHTRSNAVPRGPISSRTAAPSRCRRTGCSAACFVRHTVRSRVVAV